MLTERWFALLIVVGVLGVLARAPALIAIAAAPVVLDAVSRYLRQHALKHTHYERRFKQTQLFVGEMLTIGNRIINRSRLPVLSVYARDDSPRHFRACDAESGALLPADPTGRVLMSQQAALPGRQFASRQFTMTALRRGHFVFPNAQLQIVDLLGLATSERTAPQQDTILVYPRLWPVDELGLPANQPLGALASQQRLVEDLSRHMGARDYAPGDAFKMIHWKASAHRGSLQTRVHEHTSEPVAVVLFNVSTFADVWYGSDPLRFEWAVSVAASMAQWATDAGMTLGFTSNGCTPGSPSAIRVPARRTPEQLARVLETMAMIGPYTLHRFEEFLLLEQYRLPTNATQIIVTPMFSDAIALAVTRLVQMGKRIVLICTDTQFAHPEHLPVDTHHVPPPAHFADWLSANPEPAR
jgi:uncharacterized protein (DUF58 family)